MFAFQYPFQYPKGKCFNAYLLIFVRACQGRGHFIPKRWSVELSNGFHVRTLKEGFRRNNSLCIAYLKAPQSSCCSHKGPVKR